MIGDLTSLANYKAWAGINNAGSDSLLSRLISSSSLFLSNWINREIQLAEYIERRNGNGAASLILKNWPILDVTQVSVNGVPVPESLDGKMAGWIHDEYNVHLIGGAYRFARGLQNILVTYSAGFSQTDLLEIPAAGSQITSQDLSRVWTGGYTVSYEGTLWEKISRGTPSAGQYLLTDQGVYLFATADIGKKVSITYGSPPYDVEQACIELIATRAKEKERIGISSKSVNGESVSFSQKDMSESTRSALQQYRNVIPL